MGIFEEHEYDLEEEDAKIEFHNGLAGRDFEEKIRQSWIYGEGLDMEVETDLRDWSGELSYWEDSEDIGLMSEALYHINCDYLLSYYLQWPMFNTEQVNPLPSLLCPLENGTECPLPRSGPSGFSSLKVASCSSYCFMRVLHGKVRI